jgi:hypothetical protein
MSVNFFNNTCKEDTNSDKFGICEGNGQSPSFISQNVTDKWIANVQNNEPKFISFYAIDHCIVIKKPNGDKDMRCDAMLTYTDNLVFVELKESRSDWIGEGIQQVANTIKVFKDSHGFDQYPKRRAFIANRKHPSFQYSHKELMEKFRAENGVRLILHNIIKS